MKDVWVPVLAVWVVAVVLWWVFQVEGVWRDSAASSSFEDEDEGGWR